ncbi:carbohydrate kinase [Rhodococcus sp. HNM0569]|uniref:carbohydrate kinase family protein n=1 Tax=Rhodococcus sp. HNM0569 TaxID=2716340 RepID=UPI00146A73E3|nr:carbohydrate kinase [Rhodococcus sp. HNM0569]NLU84329.1 carbohydrate kinase [Rhodococcus sp. HNM0569]
MTGDSALPDTPRTSGALVVGEALVDIVVEAVGDASEHVGGSPLNVAVGLARLGRAVRFATDIGRDARGDTIVDRLASSGVDVVPGSVCDTQTSTATAALDARGAARYTFDFTWNPPVPTVAAAGVRVVHTGSLAAVVEPGASTVSTLLAAAAEHATVSYDPNVRPSLMPDTEATRERIAATVARADIVKASDEDLAWFAPGRDPLDVAYEWSRSGPALVVVTHGAEGALGFAASGMVDVAAPEVRVVDTVGAGDSFMAAVLDACWSLDLLGAPRRSHLRAIDTGRLRDVLERAAAASAITVSRAGAEPPTSAELARSSAR